MYRGTPAPSQSTSQHHRMIQDGKDLSGAGQGHVKAPCTGLCPGGSWIRIFEYLRSLGVKQRENTGTAAGLPRDEGWYQSSTAAPSLPVS